ncbi:class I SAM-dependent methyltransferase [Halobacillus mangrovi]|uniref:SAM-dependent methyltransferase n=1 Tax=Halobacillus mangrovi TaxID=402384 RepID=A0A1W5ZX39_9BACI|nr:class I SAM-dependent methyltransferase [Halobacillus mangrovi]ARI77868.1 SAM-dependent methyltransferase [Halobacillus mangrovi]
MSKEFWNESFSDQEYIYGLQVNEFISQKAGLISAGSKIACFAEGEGRNAVHFAKSGHEVTAYDQSSVGLEKTLELARQNGVEVNTVEADLTNDKVEQEQYDAAVMVFGHVPKAGQDFLIHNMIDSVKPGGYVMFEVYSSKQLQYGTGGPKAEEMLYEPGDLLQWIQDHECLHFYYGEAVRNEGKRHSGLCHVIQGVVRKSS